MERIGGKKANEGRVPRLDDKKKDEKSLCALFSPFEKETPRQGTMLRGREKKKGKGAGRKKRF